MTVDDEHSSLRAAWEDLHPELRNLRENLLYGDVYLMEFADKAARVGNLALHLDAAMRLSDAHLYSAAFSVLRTSLEHAVVDWLTFRGQTYIRTIAAVPAERWERWKEERASGEAWTRNVIDWERSKRGDVTIHFKGFHGDDDERQPLSIYYFLLEEYDQTMGKPSEQPDGTPFLSDLDLRELARENDAKWRTYLTWSALTKNLRLNDLADDDDLGRLAVHYRFLSAFAHPVAHSQRALYGRDLDDGRPHYDHYSSELALLYVLAIAHLELTNFREGVRGRSDVRIKGEGRLLQTLAGAAEASKHFWFLGSNPHAWDLHTARVTAELKKLASDGGEAAVDDEPVAVAFHYSPLVRLTNMHACSSEMLTSHRYESPWPRADAYRGS